MDLFEILFIAIFILIPILDGVLKQRRKRQGPPPGDEEGEETAWSGTPDAEVEATSASDMLPDDLWEVMTGERRGPAVGDERAPWSTGPDEPATATADTTPAPEDWRDESWVVDEERDAPQAGSLQYQGPEAYSLETPAPEPLERRVPTARQRHREFHALVDRPAGSSRRRKSPLVNALQTAEGLKQAVLLKEILGPPKGLE